jgi:hypothetical protein
MRVPQFAKVVQAMLQLNIGEVFVFFAHYQKALNLNQKEA